MICGRGGIGDALVLGTSGESRGGSSPSARTTGARWIVDGLIAQRETRCRNRLIWRKAQPEVRSTKKG